MDGLSLETLAQAGSIKEMLYLVFAGILMFALRMVRQLGEPFLEAKIEELKVSARSKAIESNRVVYENTLSNAIDYVDDVYEDETKRIPGITKIQVALDYIKTTEPEAYDTLGEGKLVIMIKRILAQKKKAKA